MKLVHPSDIQQQVLHRYENGVDIGFNIGFSCLKDLYRVKLGCTTYYTGAPTSGKTEFLFEILLNLSDFYGWKHVIHTPETGSPVDIVAELAHKYVRKNFKSGYGNRMSEQELYAAIAWINEHFIILDADDVAGCSLGMFLKEIDSLAINYSFQTVTIDPWDELEHDMAGLREDEYLKKHLSYIRRYARKNNIHFNIVAHPKTPQKDQNNNYLPATAYDISGGSKWYNKGEAILSLHRPSELPDGEPNTNMVLVMVQKAKPKEIGTKGTAELYFDLKANRFYEFNSTAGSMYARKDAGIINQETTHTEEGGVPF